LVEVFGLFEGVTDGFFVVEAEPLIVFLGEGVGLGAAPAAAITSNSHISS
jgi:hypothetical protein